MDSTNNEIYKIAKYLDKYTKYGNKEGGVYLQKLDNYLHKVQYGGNGEIVKLADEIGKIVTEVVKEHQQAKDKLELLLDGVKGDNLEGKIQNKINKLKVAKEGLEITIAQKKEEKLAREAPVSASSALAPASTAPVSPKAPASSAPEAVTFDTMTHVQLIKLSREEVYELVCQKAKIDSNTNGLRKAFTDRVGAWNYTVDWNFKNLIDELYSEPYFKEDDNIINLMKMIRVLLQLHARFSVGIKFPEIEEIGIIIEYLTKNKTDITIFNKYIDNITKKIDKKEDYTFTIDNFNEFKTSQPPSPASPASPAPVSTAPEPVLREKVPPSADLEAQKKQALKLAIEAREKLSVLESTPPKDPMNPNSKKFDIVGFTINKQGQSTYVIPEQQKAKVLDVLPKNLKDQLGGAVVELSTDRKKARIEFTKFLPIKEILQQINERVDPQPTEFKTTDKEGNIKDKTLNVWLFIVPATVKISERFTQQDKEYFEAINKIEEEELGKIASKMEGIIKERQSVAQSPGGRGAKGGSMTSRGSYRHPLTSE